MLNLAPQTLVFIPIIPGPKYASCNCFLKFLLRRLLILERALSLLHMFSVRSVFRSCVLGYFSIGHFKDFKDFAFVFSLVLHLFILLVISLFLLFVCLFPSLFALFFNFIHMLVIRQIVCTYITFLFFISWHSASLYKFKHGSISLLEDNISQ